MSNCCRNKSSGIGEFAVAMGAGGNDPVVGAWDGTGVVETSSEKI